MGGLSDHRAGGRMGKGGGTLADAGKLTLTFPSFQARMLAEGFPWASSTPFLPLCIDDDVNNNSSNVRKLAAASSQGPCQ